MSTLASPSITIDFTEAAASAIGRGERGIVALILKENTPPSPAHFRVYDVTEIPATLTTANKQFIKDALKGYTNAPRYITVYVMDGDAADLGAEYTNALNYFETEKFQWLAIPTVETDQKTADIVSWVQTKRQNDLLVKTVLPNANSADHEGIINWVTTLYRDANTAVTPEEGTPRIAGLLAGTGLTISATYAPLRDFVDCTRNTKSDRDTLVGAGKLNAFWDGEKVKLNRAVNSFVTTSAGKQDQYKKIKIVEDMDLMEDDIRKTIEDSYIGKFANSYDNKCLLITAVNGYFQGLINDGVLAAGVAEINVTATRTWLQQNGKDVVLPDGTVVELEDATDDQVKQANTGSHVFLHAVVSILDAIEDFDLEVNI